MRLINKLKQRLEQFKLHPIAQKHQLKAISRYIYFNMLGSSSKEMKFSWINDLQFYARKGDAGIVANIYFGLFEFDDSMFALHFSRKQDTFLDIGANLGHYSILLSGIHKCTSIAVEPVPDTFLQLKRQIELNQLTQFVQLHNIGVGDKKTELLFSNDRGTMNRVVDADYKNATQVDVLTIDELCANTKIQLMKMDVEGFEKYALAGANQLMQSDELKAIIMELNNSGEKFGVSDEEIYQQILGWGFLPYAYNPMSKTLTPLASYNRDDFNTLFIKDLPFVKNRLAEASSVKIWGTTV
jgi:FkbM family methyltransferase